MGGATPQPQIQHPDHAHPSRQRQGQYIPRAYRMGGFADGLSVHPQMAARNKGGGKAARFDESRLPKPFVQPQDRAGARPVLRRRQASDLAFERKKRGKGIVGINGFFSTRRAGLIAAGAVILTLATLAGLAALAPGLAALPGLGLT